MDSFFKFAGEHPILTFLLTIVICASIVRIIRGYPKAGDQD